MIRELERPGTPLRRAAWIAGLIIVSLAFGRIIVEPQYLRIAFVLAAALLIVGLGFNAPDALLIGLAAWLAALGLIRRVFDTLSASSRIDVLLLIAPIALAILVYRAASRGAFRDLTGLGKAVACLTALALVASVNPLEGPLLGGIASLMFVLVPLSAFWVGRSISDRTMRRLLLVIGVVGVAGALYGLAQTLVGFPSWDKAWISSGGYIALHIGTAIRPFSMYSAASEYAMFLGISIAIWLIFRLRGLTLPVAAAALLVLGLAMVYAASRSSIVLLCVGLALVLAARLRLPTPLAGVLIALALVGLIVGARSVGPVAGSSVAAQLAAHSQQGLANPFNAKTSTLNGHSRELAGGITSVVHYPVGQGLAGITIAAGKFGGNSGGTEVDPSNMAAAMGIPGLAAYLAILFLGMYKAYRLAVRRRDALSLCCLAVLGATLFTWLNGGQYAVAFLPWLILGWVDRRGNGRPEALS